MRYFQRSKKKIHLQFHQVLTFRNHGYIQKHPVLNTKYQKVCLPKPTEFSEITVTEELFLREELYKQKVKTQLIRFSIF